MNKNKANTRIVFIPGETMNSNFLCKVLACVFLLHNSCLSARASTKMKDIVAAKNSENNSKNILTLTPSLTSQELDLISFFAKPIEFTPAGIEYFFKYVYNHPEYVNHLPYSFSHMIQFLNYGISSGQNEQFASSIIKMFLQKLKAAPCVQAETLVEFLPEFTKAIKPYLEKKEANFLTEMQIILKEKLSKIFAQYFSYFQNNPDGFMTSLAEQIAKQTNQSATQQHIEVEQIKKDILRFMEMAINKLVWTSQDDVEIWYTCNRLADQSQVCLNQKILSNVDAVDDICWSLIHRLCYFTELSAESLSKDFYARVLHDVQTKPLTLTSLAEQEDLMTKKKDHLIAKMQHCRDLCESVKDLCITVHGQDGCGMPKTLTTPS